MRLRLASIWGGKYAERLVDVDDVSGEVHVTGLVERPSDVGIATRRVFISVNGRAIRDQGLVRAAESAYRSTIPAGVRPSLFLDVVLSADAIDVNVHPAKAEIRFRDRWAVEGGVEVAIRRALGTMDSVASIGSPFRNTIQNASPMAAIRQQQLDSSMLTRPTNSGEPLFMSVADAPYAKPMVGESEAESVAPLAAIPVYDATVPQLLQLRRTYIMFEHEEGVVLIDQHSAHERVLYEQFMRLFESGGAASQRLLIPLTLHLGPAQANAFEQHRDYLERLGFEIEGFGGHTLLVNSVPVPHPRFDAERCLRDTLDALTGDRLAGVATRHERLAATVACKAAIKAGDVLSQPEMQALFIALRDTQLPAHDVHGRSTIVQLSWAEVERRFGRA
jgi:DNA mismatch repair protein MutL